MSVSINDGFKQTLATGGETSIDFDFRIDASSDIRVLKTAVDDTLTELTNPTHYTVPGGSIGVDGGGTITLVTPAVAGEKYTCISNYSETRSTNFTLLGGFQSEELNKQLDRLTRIDQQLRRDINKTVNLREDSTVTGVTIPNPVSNNLLGWDSSGTEMVNYEIADVSASLDATFNGLATNDLIKWDGSNWVNTPNVQFSQIDANFIADATTATPVATDLIPFADVSDSNNTKKTTISTILGLITNVTNAMLSTMGANTVKVNATASSATPTDLALSASQLLGRGSTGNVAAITLGTGLSMSGTTLNASVSPFLVKCCFNGTGTPSFYGTPTNCSSITDNGTGDWTINFTSALPDTNYVALMSGGTTSSSLVWEYARTTSSISLRAASPSTLVDITRINLVIV